MRSIHVCITACLFWQFIAYAIVQLLKQFYCARKLRHKLPQFIAVCHGPKIQWQRYDTSHCLSLYCINVTKIRYKFHRKDRNSFSNENLCPILGNLIHFLYNLLTTDTTLEITFSTKLRYKNKQQSRVQRSGVKFIIYRLMVNFFYNVKMFNAWIFNSTLLAEKVHACLLCEWLTTFT